MLVKIINAQFYLIAKFVKIEKFKFLKRYINKKQIRRNTRSSNIKILN